MKCFLKPLALITLFFTVTVSCSFLFEEDKKDENFDCDDLDLAIAYSIAYSPDSSYAEICYSDASSNISSMANVTLQLIGPGTHTDYNCNKVTNNGEYSIVLTYNQDDLQCSTSKIIYIHGLK